MIVGKLYSTAISPPVRAVYLLEKALGIETEHIEVNLYNRENLKDEYVKLNPQHTVPLYIDQDGTKIWDSHAIMAFIVGKYAKCDNLYPKDLSKRAMIDQRMHFETGNVFTVLRAIVLPMWVAGSKEIPARQVQLANEAYNFLNEFLKDQPWTCGDSLSIADFSLISTVSSLHHLVPIDSKFTRVHEWIARCEKLPYYREANGIGDDLFKESVIKALG